MRKRRLTLCRETVRALTHPGLKAAAGGSAPDGYTCPETCAYSCDYCPPDVQDTAACNPSLSCVCNSGGRTACCGG